MWWTRNKINPLCLEKYTKEKTDNVSDLIFIDKYTFLNTVQCSKEKDSETNPFWTSKLTTNLLKPNTHFNSCHPPRVKNGFTKAKW